MTCVNIVVRLPPKPPGLDVVTRYFDTKFTEKSKQILRQPGPFIQMQICFWQKEKKRIGEYTAKLTFLCYDNFG